MRLYHYKLLLVLPQQMIISQWRECIAIKRQWEKGTLKHRLVSYVMDYPKCYFIHYVSRLINELEERNIKFQEKYLDELITFCGGYPLVGVLLNYEEHNDRYLKQCYFNLQEKYDRGIVTEEEWSKIYAALGDEVNEI